MYDGIRYKKIEVLVKTSKDSIGSTKFDFVDSWYKIEGNYFIIITHEKENIFTNRILNMNEIHAFKTEQ